MRTLFIIVSVATATALTSFAVSAYIFYNKWQSLRVELESVILTEPVDIQSFTLEEASEKVADQVRRKRHVPITCIFHPPSLGSKRPVIRAKLDGSAFFGIKALEESYACRATLAGDRMIVFTERERQ